MARRSGSRLAALAALCLLLVGCDQASPRAGTSDDPAATGQATTDPTPAAPSPTPERIAERCDFDVPGRTFTIPVPGGKSWLSAVEFGSGPHAAVFLHEAGHSFLCGWVPYAEWAARHGVHAIAIDACSYGRSVCSDRDRRDVETWVGAAIDWAREHGARRVTLVGASMGGALATGVGQQVGADAIVNLSGPNSWQGVPNVHRAAGSIRVPFLVAAADSDEAINTAALRRAVRVAPADVTRYVATPDGHGWSMVTKGVLVNAPADTHPTPLGRLLLDWIRGSVG